MPTLTTTANPPSTHIVFYDLNPATQRLTLYRMYDTFTGTVRSAVDVFAAGGWVGDDWETPPGVPVTYRAQQFDVDGNELGYTDPVTVTIPVSSPEDMWLSDPFDATSAIKVRAAVGTGQQPSRPVPGTVLRVGDRTVVLASPQGLLQDLKMDFITITTEDQEAVLALIQRTSGLILIRTPPPMMVPRLLYCWASNPIPDAFDLPHGDQRVSWANQVQEITPVEGDVQVVPVTWQTYMDAFPTWGDMDAAYLNWFDAMSNPPEV